MHTAPKAGQNDSDPTETEMGGSARGGQGMNCATYCNRDPQQRVSVCVSVVGGCRARAAWSLERLVVSKYSIVVTKYIPVTIVSMAGR